MFLIRLIRSLILRIIAAIGLLFLAMLIATAAFLVGVVLSVLIPIGILVLGICLVIGVILARPKTGVDSAE